MKISLIKISLFAFLILVSISIAQNSSGISVDVNKKTGEYTIVSKQINWKFRGSVGHELSNIIKTQGSDALGNFKQIRFDWSSDIPYRGSIKWYEKIPVVLFALTLSENLNSGPEAFPSFTEFPSGMNEFSFKNGTFAPPQFKLNETSTPWLFFNKKMNSFIISPASDFIVAKMKGDGKNVIASGLNEEIKNLPKNFSHSTILVFSKSIKGSWKLWGKAMRSIYQREIPANDSEPMLKYFGYWTDNGADYYYNYDTTMGYARTLLALRERYKDEGIPLGYMQLDSWWYEKSIYDPNGKPDADHKNPNLPSGKWNRYGGMMNYTADPFLFPEGLHAFQKELDLPMVTHNRWIDPKSGYHNKYKISGYAAVDRDYWQHIMDYINDAGVICYEQDWLNYIYDKSPEMADDINIGNRFTDGMADACLKNGMTMQYCMAMPRFFLQGLKYNNLTTIRTSGDRFEPKKWKHFIYTSQLAHECGIYPWCDVFKSGEEGNMILSVLSAGPVGTGDSMGKEDKSNIMKVCRTDGVLVKPDVPIVPVDQDYINDAEGSNSPMLAYTYTRHGKIKTGYVFAFIKDSSYDRSINFRPSKLGVKGETVVYDPLTKEVQAVGDKAGFSGSLSGGLYTYYIVAPLMPSGIAFLGDENKITATGKKRIADIKYENGDLKVKVLFAEGESSIRLNGYSKNPVYSDKGEIKYNTDNHMFNLNLSSGGKKEVTILLTAKEY